MALTQNEQYLFTAIQQGNIPQITALVTRHLHTQQRMVNDNIHAMLNEYGFSPLHVAAIQDNPEILRTLLNHYPGCDINYRCGQGLFSPIHLAAQYGKLPTLGVLFSFNADINILDGNGNSPLLLAIQANINTVANWLLQIKAHPNIRNTAGQTALDMAIANNNAQLTESLLESGFDIQQMYDENTRGTILQNPNQDIVQVLNEYTALHFTNYTIQEKFTNLDGLNQQQLFELQVEILSTQAKILDASAVRLLEHLQRRIEIKNYPNACANYAIKLYPNRKPIETFVANDACYYLYVPAMTQNHTHYPAFLTPIPTGATRAEIINKLITSLVYASKRYRMDEPACDFRLCTIRWINPRYINFTDIAQFEQHIVRRENRGATFFGEDLSEDSDDALLADPNVDLNTYNYSQNIIHRIGVSFFKTEMTTVLSRKEYIGEEKASNRMDKLLAQKKQSKARASLPYHWLDPQAPLGVSPNLEAARKDLIILNRHIKNGMPIEKAVLRIKTKFFVAQYRGISYDLGWNARSRRAHRQADERNYPYYSNAVYSAALFNITREYSQEKHFSPAMQALLKLVGEKSQAMLYVMHHTTEFRAPHYHFDNFAEYIQDRYTKDYKNFHASLGPGGDLFSHQGTYFLNDKNPFVSTSDRPYHALRYALGTKPYADNENRRLRPRWTQGRAERPYSGKVYISLHAVTDYNAQYPMHLTSLVRKGKSNVYNNVLAERETTFPAMIPEGRIISQLVARYPSFRNPYHHKYMEKYGLDKELYDLFATALMRFPPHSYENRYVKKLLGNWLSAYHEVRLINIAFQEAMNRGGVLLYQSDDGGFSMELPPCGVRKERANYTEITLARQNRT